MSKVQPDLSERHGFEVHLPDARLIDRAQGRVVERRENSSICEREVGDRETRIVMTHHCADDQLREDREDTSDGQSE